MSLVSAPELVHGVLEALRDVVDLLVGLVVVRLHGGRGRVELAQLGLVGERVEQLAVGGEQAGPVGADFAVLPAEAELDGEPVELDWGQREKEC